MRLFLAAALAVFSALAFASPESGAGFEPLASWGDCEGCCKRCHSSVEGLEEPSEPVAFDLAKSDWGTRTAARRWDHLRRRLSATSRHE